MNNQKTKKTAWIDFLLCFFFGCYGVHKFREKKIGIGVLYLLTMGLFTFGWVYDCAGYFYSAICISKAGDAMIEGEPQEEIPVYHTKAKKIGWIAVIAWFVLLIWAGSCAPNTEQPDLPSDDVGTVIEQTEQQESNKDSEQNVDDLVEENDEEPGKDEEPVKDEEPAKDEEPLKDEESDKEEPKLPAETHIHSYSEATCIQAKKCSCGATEGAPLGHQWKDATCERPKTCTVCGATEGSAVGHSWKDATCTAAKSCTICGITSGSALGHQWKDATYSSPKQCVNCSTTEGDALQKPGAENYHGHVYTGGSSSKKYHYEAQCAGKNSHEITLEEVDRRNLGPCGTCVLK